MSNPFVLPTRRPLLLNALAGWLCFVPCLLLLGGVSASHAADDPDGPTVLQRATQAAGGEAWAKVKTLMLGGRAEFWGPSGAAPRSAADSCVMWRVFDPDRSPARSAKAR
jgi:hypothetical protein